MQRSLRGRAVRAVGLAGWRQSLVSYHLRQLRDGGLIPMRGCAADGELLRVDAENHPDLFWAIRGGGGNFGVATRFQFRLHDIESFVGDMLFLPATPGAIESFVVEAEAAPDERSTIANVLPAPPMPFLPPEQHGRLVVMAMLAYAGPAEDGRRAIAPFRALAPPIADGVRPMRDPEMCPREHEPWVSGLAAELKRHDDGAYAGFLADEGEERVRAAYPGATWDRLAEIKARYDPDNLFRLNQNVPPAR